MSSRPSQFVHPDCIDPAICNNCDWSGLAKETLFVAEIGSRLEPGDTVPAGECPQCGAFAHLVDQDRATGLIKSHLARLGLADSITEHHTGSGDDNYVALMLRHSDLPHIKALADQWEELLETRFEPCSCSPDPKGQQVDLFA